MNKEERERKNLAQKKYYENNKEKIKMKRQEPRAREMAKINQAKYNKTQKGKEMKQKVDKKYRETHKEELKLRDYNGKYRETHKEKIEEYDKHYREKNPEKIKAQAQARAIKIEVDLCESCNKEQATQRHHEDYSKPLEVVFVCGACHYKLDEQRRAREQNKELRCICQ